MCTLSKWRLYFPQLSGTPKSKAHRPSKTNVLGSHLPGPGPLPGEADVGLRPFPPWVEAL